jgi:hypothetical protein
VRKPAASTAFNPQSRIKAAAMLGDKNIDIGRRGAARLSQAGKNMRLLQPVLVIVLAEIAKQARRPAQKDGIDRFRLRS